MSNLQIVSEQYKKLPVLVNSEICSGKVYIVTGANIGLGLETARHLVRCSAARVILAVRNMVAGENAKDDIETSTGRTGVAEVWQLDLASFASVQAFASKAMVQLERIDALVENASVALDKWTVAEGMETSMTVNVTSTFLLGMLMMPKLIDSARRFNIKPRLVIVTAPYFTAQKELAKGGGVNIFQGLNDPKGADMDQRYALTKIVQLYLVRELAVLFPTERTRVIINMVSPGLCTTGLTRELRSWTRTMISMARTVMARTAEEGSRTLLHAVVADEDSHGKLLSGCKIKDDWLPDWMTNVDGQRTQKQLCKELIAKLEAIQPGCVSKLS